MDLTVIRNNRDQGFKADIGRETRVRRSCEKKGSEPGYDMMSGQGPGSDDPESQYLEPKHPLNMGCDRVSHL